MPDVTLQPVCGFLKRTIRPFLGFTARLVELFNRIARRFRWREGFGASEEPGGCPQLSSVCCLRRRQQSVVFFVRFTRTLAPPFQLLLFFLILDGFFQELFQVAFSARACRFLISSLMLPTPSSCCLRPGATRRIRWGVMSDILLHNLWIGAAVLASAACIAWSRAWSRT